MNSFLRQQAESGAPAIDPQAIEELRLAEEEEEKLRQQQQQATQPEATASTPKPEQPKPQPQAKEEKPKEDFYGADLSFQDDGVDPSGLQVAAEAVLSPFAGATDAVVDFINLAPGVDLPKIPEFENEVAQTVREMSSIVLPTIGLTATGAGALAGAAKASKFKILADPFVKKIGSLAFSAGTGAFVDYTVEINQTDDNLTGTLKQAWPSWYGWIPDDLATLPTDGADMKRAKNVTEGVYLGVGTDVLIGGVKLLQSYRKLRTKYIPKSEKAGEIAKRLNEQAEMTPEEAVNASVEARVAAQDDMGTVNLDQAIARADGDVELALSEPIRGVHDLYGYEETVGRSVDVGGVNSAAIDFHQTVTNAGGSINGRVGSMLTDSALTKGLADTKEMATILKGIGEALKDTDIDVRFPNGDYSTAKEIAKSGEDNAAQYFNMPFKRLKEVFEFDVSRSGIVDKDAGVAGLSPQGMETARLLIKKYASDLININSAKGEAYLATSLAGQVSDTAQGIRLTEGTAAIENASNDLIKRIEFLMAMRGRSAYIRGRALNLVNMWDRLKKKGTPQAKKNQMEYAKRIDSIIADTKGETASALERIKNDAKISADTLREIVEKKPDYIKPLILAYEFTDGRVQTMASLNKFLEKSTGIIRKSFYDGDPGIPSAILNAFWSNVYNSTLSAFATPIKAGVSNMAGLVEKPIGALIGGMRVGEGKMVRRAIYQYTLDAEILQDALGYMKEVFKRSATEANVADLARENVFQKNQDQIDILHAIVEAKKADGDPNYAGAAFAVQRIQDMNDLANHPWLRFGNRAMQALDGFTQTMIAHAETRGRIFDQVTENGLKEFDGAKADQIYKQTYSEMFDEDGLITDKAVKYTAGEIALSVDNAATRGVSELIARFPVMRPFLLFTKTPTNDLIMMKSYSPHNLFMMEKNKFRLKPQDMAMEDVKGLLKTRGYDNVDVDSLAPEELFQRYREIRADLYGRSALGNLMVGAAVGLFMTDRITGNGLADKEKQAVRRDTDWKPRSIRLPGGNWISYDNLGPVSNWFATVADIMDNFDSLTPNTVQELLNKSTFIFAASVTDKSFMAGLEPFLDVARGDAGAINRWAGSFLIAANAPMSSQLAEISRLMDPGLKEVEMTMFDVMRNRLPVLKGQMPKKYDWIDGDPVGEPGSGLGGFMTRVWNVYSPWKISGKISEEKKFLQMIEYDARPTLRTNGRGVRLSPAERSDIANIMGREGLFKKAIRRVMNTVEGREFRRSYMDAVNKGLTPDLKTFERVHRLLDRALRTSMMQATAMSDYNDSIRQKELINNITTRLLKNGRQDEARDFVENMKKFSQ